MKTYVYLVEQYIAVKANSKEEAEGLLPMYPTGYEGQAHTTSKIKLGLFLSYLQKKRSSN